MIDFHQLAHILFQLNNLAAYIALGGACSGCGISPMTIQAIKSRMVKEIPEVEKVHAHTGMDDGGSGGASPSFPGEPVDDGGENEGPQAPF